MRSDQETATEPSVSDYGYIGVIGVTSTNLSTINDRIRSAGFNSSTGIYQLSYKVNTALSEERILTYANNAQETAPTYDDYQYLNYTILTEDEANMYNQVLSNYSTSLSTISDLKSIIDAYNQVAIDINAGLVSSNLVSHLNLMGFSYVSSDNIATIFADVLSNNITPENIDGLYTTIIAKEENLITLKINAYSLDDTQPSPSSAEYTYLGFPDLSQGDIDFNNSLFTSNLITLTTFAQIKSTVTAHNQLINAINTNTVNNTSVNDISSFGFTYIDNDNVTELISLLHTNDYSNDASGGNFQTLFDDIKTFERSVVTQIFQDYANDVSEIAPTITDYQYLGYSELTQAQVDVFNVNLADDPVDFTNKIFIFNTVKNELNQLIISGSTVNNLNSLGFNFINDVNIQYLYDQFEVSNSTIDSFISLNLFLQDFNADITGVTNSLINFGDGSGSTPTINDYRYLGIDNLEQGDIEDTNQFMDTFNVKFINRDQIKQLVNSFKDINDAISTGNISNELIESLHLLGFYNINESNVNGIIQEIISNEGASLTVPELLNQIASLNSEQDEAELVSYQAIDGYLQYAAVYVDRNNDGVADSDEYFTITNEDGGFELLSDDSAYGVLVKTVDGQTIDSDYPDTVIDYNLELYAQSGLSEVTPFTTLAYLCDLTFSELADQLDLPIETINGDYVSEANTDISTSDQFKAAVIGRSLRFLFEEELSQNHCETLSDNVDLLVNAVDNYSGTTDLRTLVLEYDGTTFVESEIAANYEITSNSDNSNKSGGSVNILFLVLLFSHVLFRVRTKYSKRSCV
ncbi:hypothetical protein L0B53_15830 [Vibrio sp. SS-MA-C1-2]|uniref:hypothetical protein n=1 Tax=Vibrio sp. SS-MA-C1-2 TaxID=2908646 RepID=UPI001F2B1DC1|nr:hypothetical protein [Vibrio sp. SS-MA-C1-2]UJF18475.1 hypothetical protein L0B53_15830 [Vibrio sp. SS-MA-C1-2]